MAETNNRKIVQGEDIIILLDDKPTLHATTHNLKVDLELKDIRTKDTNGKEKFPGDISWSVDGDGLVVIDPSIANSHTSEDVLALVLSKKLVNVVLKSPVSGLTKTYSGEENFERQLDTRSKTQGKLMLTMFPHKKIEEYVERFGWIIHRIERTITASKTSRRRQEKWMVTNR